MKTRDEHLSDFANGVIEMLEEVKRSIAPATIMSLQLNVEDDDVKLVIMGGDTGNFYVSHYPPIETEGQLEQ